MNIAAPPAPPTDVDYSRKWFVMTAIAMSLFLEVIDFSAVNIAIPTIAAELNTTFATVQWVVLASMLTQTTLMLSIGRLGDMLGKKPIFLAGFVVFMIGGLACGLSPSIGWLIFFRIIQALGGTMMAGLVFAIVTEAFPPRERGKAVGLISLLVSIGIVLGPMIGGPVIDALSWRWAFWIGLPTGFIGIILSIKFVPASKPAGRQKFDYLGAVAFFFTLLTLLLALTLGQERGYQDSRILLLFAGFIIFLIAFVWIEWRIPEPMINLRLFKNKLFSSNLVVRVLSFVGQSGLLFLLPFYLQNILGYSPSRVGPLMIVTPICLGLMAPMSGMLSDKFGSVRISVVGLIIIIMGYFAVSTLTVDTTVIGYILRLIPVGIGMGIFQSPNNSAIMGSVPRERLGIASGLVGITRTLGSTAGVATLGALWASRASYYVGERLSGGATTAPLSAQMSGLQDTFQVVALLMIVALFINLWTLRHLKGEALN